MEEYFRDDPLVLSWWRSRTVGLQHPGEVDLAVAGTVVQHVFFSDGEQVEFLLDETLTALREIRAAALLCMEGPVEDQEDLLAESLAFDVVVEQAVDAEELKQQFCLAKQFGLVQMLEPLTIDVAVDM